MRTEKAEGDLESNPSQSVIAMLADSSAAVHRDDSPQVRKHLVLAIKISWNMML